MTVEDPDTVHDYFEHDATREEAVALKCRIFTNAGEVLKNLGMDLDDAPE